MLGRFIPYIPVTTKDLNKLNFDEGRIRWMSQPHIFTEEVRTALQTGWSGDSHELTKAVEETCNQALDRIGQEELWLFKKTIRGSKDIEAMNLHPSAKAFLIKAWANRFFLEYEKGCFVPTWLYKDSRAYRSLSEKEKETLEALLEERQKESEKIWEREGRKLLSVLASSSSMLPCAEDLGAVPECVPRVLKELNILGLRVVRWFREWDKEGQPYVPFEDYPELTVCTPAVHDSSCLREWWDREADQEQFIRFLGLHSLPKVYNPGMAKTVLQKIAGAGSRFRVFQIQDLLHLSHKWYSPDPAQERINVPGTLTEFNWTWRLPATPEEIGKDEELVKAVKELAAIKPSPQKTVKGKKQA
jgi:4-alpha-glucanotransferase